MNDVARTLEEPLSSIWRRVTNRPWIDHGKLVPGVTITCSRDGDWLLVRAESGHTGYWIQFSLNTYCRGGTLGDFYRKEMRNAVELGDPMAGFIPWGPYAQGEEADDA